MTKKVYLNPDRLDTAINSLTYLADDAETAKTNIDNQFSAEGDPMDPSTDLFTIGNSIETVRGLVSTLTSFKQAILDANNSGVGSMDAGGGITIELSDNASVNSPEQVNACIRAAADATDLAAIQAGKNPKSKRSYEEIMESLRANQDDAAYADGIIDSIGLDALTAFPLRNSEHSSEDSRDIGQAVGNGLHCVVGRPIQRSCRGNGGVRGRRSGERIRENHRPEHHARQTRRRWRPRR